MAVETDIRELNPQITDATIGVRSLRTIKVYPLSLGDQLEMTDLIINIIQGFFAGKDQRDEVFVILILKMIKDNLGKILALACPDEKDSDALLKDITNQQAVAIVQIIYDINFKDLEGNVKSLFGSLNQTLSGRPLPTSVNDTAIDPENFSTEGTETVE